MIQKRGNRRPDQAPVPRDSSSLHEDVCDSTAIRQQLHRRREAARRVAPLDCGCPDPWPCRCTDPPLSTLAVEGWRDAALAVLSVGLIPMLPIEARRALWSRGGRDRLLAELLHDACGDEAT